MLDEQLDGARLIEEIVDHVMALLPPYETSLYLYLLRKSHLLGAQTVRVGKRTIGEGLGKGTRSSQGNYQHITEKLNNLARDGFIQIGDTDRSGTLYTVFLPSEVAAVRERIATSEPSLTPADHYRDPVLRARLFERDAWRCCYCGEVVTPDTATLDHRLPVSKGGGDDPENLATACLMCNSIKSGRTYEEAAPQILASVQARRTGGPS
jgi:hypothetical protein